MSISNEPSPNWDSAQLIGETPQRRELRQELEDISGLEIRAMITQVLLHAKEEEIVRQEEIGLKQEIYKVPEVAEGFEIKLIRRTSQTWSDITDGWKWDTDPNAQEYVISVYDKNNAVTTLIKPQPGNWESAGTNVYLTCKGPKEPNGSAILTTSRNAPIVFDFGENKVEDAPIKPEDLIASATAATRVVKNLLEE